MSADDAKPPEPAVGLVPSNGDSAGFEGFRREVDLDMTIDDFQTGAVIPLPRYFGTETWVFPNRWTPEGGDEPR